ncbi:hypothetical protein HYFRA_00009477 [Hymenoscyphus fraxineus]|uniref:Homeobox domain-containing protein n=1 Tax=Hymenoscyphus fraxineus TaxID=746836 RepID=A0A9N9KXX6_9HELO|nr:hypothetical protein HYFRA_00009477 [Hymenoscyphus fraxineus]
MSIQQRMSLMAIMNNPAAPPNPPAQGQHGAPLPNGPINANPPAPAAAKFTISVGQEKRELLKEYFRNHPYDQPLSARQEHEGFVAAVLGISPRQVQKNFGEFRRREKKKLKKAEKAEKAKKAKKEKKEKKEKKD